MVHLAAHFSNVLRLKLKSLRDGLRTTTAQKTDSQLLFCLNLKRDLGNLVLAHGLLEAGDAGVLDVSVDDNQIGLAGGKDPLAISGNVHANDGVYGGVVQHAQGKADEEKKMSKRRLLPPNPGRWVFAFLLIWLKSRMSPFLLATTSSPFSVVAVLLKSFLASLAYCLLLATKAKERSSVRRKHTVSVAISLHPCIACEKNLENLRHFLHLLVA